MPVPAILISTWGEGIFSVTGKAIGREFSGRAVRSLTPDGRGGVLAIVDGHSLYRRSGDAQWTQVATSEADLSCCIAVGDAILVGTDAARLLRIEADGTQHVLAGFDAVPGREAWYAGGMMVDGKYMGPPLGIRSLAMTCDGTLLANVHVGGIPRSVDAGKTWRPTIDIDADVHQVCTHPSRPELVIAAAAVGLCISRDGGETWTIERRGLHAPHCSAVAFGRSDILISASVDPFSSQGAIYRRPIESDGPLQRLGGGMPYWTAGKVDTDCIGTQGATVALVDWSGYLYVSQDDGTTWEAPLMVAPGPSGLHICAA